MASASLTAQTIELLKLGAIVTSAIVASGALTVNAYATFRGVSSRRLLNYQELVKSHRDLWKLTLDKPDAFARILESRVDLIGQPITSIERRFVGLLLLHATTAFVFAKKRDIVKIEQVKRDIDEIIALPIPREVWRTTKHYFNVDFVRFVERTPRSRWWRLRRKRPLSYGDRWNILVLSGLSSRLVDTLAQYGDRLIFMDDAQPLPTRQFIVANDIDFVVCFGYGRKLTQEILTLVTAVNVHPSLLPLGRGPNPHLWSVLLKTSRGATVHYIDEGFDTGDVIRQIHLPDPDQSMTFRASFEDLMDASARLFAETWPSIRMCSNERTPQVGAGSRHTFQDQAALTGLWNDVDLALSLEQFREKASTLLNKWHPKAAAGRQLAVGDERAEARTIARLAGRGRPEGVESRRSGLGATAERRDETERAAVVLDDSLRKKPGEGGSAVEAEGVLDDPFVRGNVGSAGFEEPPKDG